MAYSKSYGCDILNEIEERMWAFSDVDWTELLWDGVSGSTEDAEDAVFRLPNSDRGRFAVAAYALLAPVLTFRTILNHVWDHDHDELISAVRGRKSTIRAMMRRAQYDTSDLPDTFTVYRGTTRITHSQAARGLAWTTSPDVACWFAARYRMGAEGAPLVIEATAKRSDVVFWHRGRSEDEVVMCRDFMPAETRIFSAPEAWERHADALAAKWKAEHEAETQEAA